MGFGFGRNNFLGQQVLYDGSEGTLIHSAAKGGPGGGHGGRPGGGGTTPSPTVVGSSTGFQFDLMWDSSVSNAPSGFMSAVTNTASYLASLFSNREVVNVHIGWGAVNSQTLSAGALGESQTNGYLTDYATVASHFAAGTFSASNEPTGSQFFVANAEAKSWNMVDPTSSTVDGYIGFGTLANTGYSWNMTTSSNGAGTGTGLNQFDLQSVVQHEMTEVMGRIGMEGTSVFNGRATDTPYDLFNFNSPGVLELSGGGGYFSTDNGTTNLGNFNNASAYGGDIADWASHSSISEAGTTGLVSGDQDAFNAFGRSGINGDLSRSDVLTGQSLGYSLSSGGNSLV